MTLRARHLDLEPVRPDQLMSLADIPLAASADDAEAARSELASLEAGQP